MHYTGMGAVDNIINQVVEGWNNYIITRSGIKQYLKQTKMTEKKIYFD